MLRRRAWVEVFAAVFFEAGRRGDGWIERDAGVFAGRGGCDSERRKEATCCFVSAWSGGWIEYCCAVRRAELLPDAAVDCDSAAEEWIAGCGGGPRWIFRIASEFGSAGAAFSQEPIGDCSCGGIARSDAFTFRRAGFYGVWHAGVESDRRRLVESRDRKRPCRRSLAVSRGGYGAESAAQVTRKRAGD